MATAAISTRIIRRVSPTISSVNLVIGSDRPFRKPERCSGGGYCLRSDGASDPTSARACSSVTPAFSRAMSVLLYCIPHPWRSRGEKAIGRKTDAGSKLRPLPRGGNSNRSPITPTTVYGWRSRAMVRPITCGSRPNTRVHNR
jgi:hypothetical protein